MDLFIDWNMIVAGIKQTFGDVDIMKLRARDFLNIYLPNMHKDTTIMQIVRIRQTPTSKLSEEERKVKIAHRLPNAHMHLPSFGGALKQYKKAGDM